MSKVYTNNITLGNLATSEIGNPEKREIMIAIDKKEMTLRVGIEVETTSQTQHEYFYIIFRPASVSSPCLEDPFLY